MKIETITAHGRIYKVCNGTLYYLETPDRLIEIIEDIREKKIRIRIEYGDVNTGKSWGETRDISGTIGRSTGIVKLPILIHNSRSTGGGVILTHCILEIRKSKGKELIYRHNESEKGV
jgi:hypothetical protein